MSKNNSKMVQVYVVEQSMIEEIPIVNMGIRNVSKGGFLDFAYKTIGCSLVDVREFECNGKYYDAWFDEEFLFSGKPLVATLLLGDLKPNAFDLICGSFIVAHSDEEGATCGITTEEANELAGFMHKNYLRIQQARDMGLFGKKSA